MELYLVIVGAATAFFVAWNNGSNNAADAIGAAVGSGAITLPKALIIASIADFVGAILFGKYVSKTLMYDIVNMSALHARDVVAGMLSILITTGLLILVSTILRTPMSVTEGVVGGLIGFGIAAVGLSMVNWFTVTLIVTSWAVLPLFAAVLTLAVHVVFEKMFRSPKLLPVAGASSMFIIAFSASFLLTFKTLAIKDISYATLTSTLIGAAAVAVFLTYYLVARRRFREGGLDRAVIKALILIAVASIAFSHGANDVAKSAGPLTAIALALSRGYVPPEMGVDIFALAFCASGIAIGIVSWGSRVVETIGEKITTLTYYSAFTSQLGTALSVLIMTRLGMPVSTTMAIVGSVAGVGIARGIKAVNVRTLARIFGAWAAAAPVTIGSAAGLYLLLRAVI